MSAVHSVEPAENEVQGRAPGWELLPSDHGRTILRAYWDGRAWTAVVRQGPGGAEEDRVVLDSTSSGEDLVPVAVRLLEARDRQRRSGAAVAAGGFTAAALAVLVIGIGIANAAWPGWVLGIGLPLVVTCGPTIGLMHLGRGRGPCRLVDQPPARGRPGFEGHRVEDQGIRAFPGVVGVLVVVGVTLGTLLTLAAAAALILMMLLEAANEGL